MRFEERISNLIFNNERNEFSKIISDLIFNYEKE